MKEARLGSGALARRVAIHLGEPGLARALAAELAVVGDFETVAAGDTPDLVVTDDPDDPSEDGAALVFLQPRTGGTPHPLARALLPHGLDPKRIVDAVRLVAAGLVIVPYHSSPEPDAEEVAPPRPALTRREREVLALLAAGASNKEIARRLDISVHTVKFHMASLFAKLGATSRLEAVGIGLRSGLVMM